MLRSGEKVKRETDERRFEKYVTVGRTNERTNERACYPSKRATGVIYVIVAWESNVRNGIIHDITLRSSVLVVLRMD